MANTNYIDSFEVNGVEIPVRDPGISQWAREPSAPEYTAEDVGAFPAVPGGSAGPPMDRNGKHRVGRHRITRPLPLPSGHRPMRRRP